MIDNNLEVLRSSTQDNFPTELMKEVNKEEAKKKEEESQEQLLKAIYFSKGTIPLLVPTTCSYVTLHFPLYQQKSCKRSIGVALQPLRRSGASLWDNTVHNAPLIFL